MDDRGWKIDDRGHSLTIDGDDRRENGELSQQENAAFDGAVTSLLFSSEELHARRF